MQSLMKTNVKSFWNFRRSEITFPSYVVQRGNPYIRFVNLLRVH